MLRQRTDQRQLTRRRRSSLVVSHRTHRLMRWRLISISSEKLKKLWCWWTNKRRDIVDLDLWALLMVSWMIDGWYIKLIDRINHFRGRCWSHLWNSLPHHQEQEGRMQEGSAKRDCDTSYTTSITKAIDNERIGSSYAKWNGCSSRISRSCSHATLSIQSSSSSKYFANFKYSLHIFIRKAYGFQAQAAANVHQNHMAAASGAAAVTGGKLFATYPPSFHALR